MEANELMRYAYELLQGHSNEECARILREVSYPDIGRHIYKLINVLLL